MKPFSRARRLIFAAMFGWFVILDCHTTDLIALGSPSATSTSAPTVRATFTRVPPTVPPPPPQPTSPPPPTAPPTRAPTLRPPPTRVPTPKPAAPPPAPPTADLFGGYYYRPVDKGCVAAGNTRIEGTVYDNGLKKNGVIVRLSHGEHLDPLINDFVTGTDPSDYKHIDPAFDGKYRLGIAEGQRIDGNWWVFIVDGSGAPLSKGFYVKTHDAPGCNTATVDFVH